MDRIGLVFDFDGTMCRLFRNYDLNRTKAELHDRMYQHGYDFPLDNDPFDVFQLIGNRTDLYTEQKTELFEEMNAVLVSAELEAVQNCELVNGVTEMLPYFQAVGYQIGVATNNSPECVSEFLDLYCGGLTIPIVGRVGSRPELMKPNGWSLIEVLKKMDCVVDNTLFFGDTQRDYECARNVGCRFIGVAPTEQKLKRLQHIKPEIEIVSDFFELNRKIPLG